MIDPKIVIGLGFGDEGKGMAVAHEVEKAIGCGLRPVVVRFNGGPQAGHNVRVIRDGKVLHHTHSQIGSGALLGAETCIMRGMLFDVFSFENEAEHLSRLTGKNVRETVLLDERCPTILPVHVIANRELDKINRHGSTGNGIGIARECGEAAANGDADPSMTIRVGDMLDIGRGDLYDRIGYWARWISVRHGDIDLHCGDDDLWEWSGMLIDAWRRECDKGLLPVWSMDLVIRNMVCDGEHGVVFEGSQGMLLDKRVGWFPHVTYGDMDAFEARRMCGGTRAKVIGVTRSYQTRHGAGPMPTEGTCDIPEADNETYEWAGAFRTGLLDVPNLARAAAATCVDEIAISHMDRYPGAYVATWHDRGNVVGIDRDVPRDPFVVKSGEEKLVRRIEDACHAPVTVVGRGPTTDCWQDRK